MRFIILLACVAFLLPPNAAERRPLAERRPRTECRPLTEAAHPGAKLAKDFVDAAVSWNRMHLREFYEAQESRDRSIDADACVLLDAYAHIFSNRSSEVDDATLIAAGERLLAAQVSDALLIYLCGKTRELAGDPDGAHALYATAADSLYGTGLPACRSFFAQLRLLDKILATEPLDKEAADLAMDRIFAEFQRAWQAGEWESLPRQLIAQIIDVTPQHESVKAGWLERCATVARAHADTCAGATILGWVANEQGWMARGGGWGYTVTEEGGNVFQEKLAEAERELTRAWKLDQTIPIAPAIMIAVAMSSRTADNERTWFDRAVAVEFDNWLAYQKLTWSLYPRWGGSYRAMIAFGRECAETKRYDTEVPYVLPDTVLNVMNDAKQMERTQDLDPIFADATLWKDIDTVYADAIAYDQSKVAWLRSMQVGFAFRFHQIEAMRERYELLNGEVMFRALALLDVHFDEVKRLAVPVEGDF